MTPDAAASAEDLALLATGLFAGAALYVSLIEHPARLQAGDKVALRQFRPSYHRGARLQITLAVVGPLAGLAAWLLGSSILWMCSALALFSLIPITLLLILPTNKRLNDPALKPGDPEAARLLLRWGHLHTLRTAVGLLAFLLQIAARSRVWG